MLSLSAYWQGVDACHMHHMSFYTTVLASAFGCSALSPCSTYNGSRTFSHSPQLVHALCRASACGTGPTLCQCMSDCMFFCNVCFCRSLHVPCGTHTVSCTSSAEFLFFARVASCDAGPIPCQCMFDGILFCNNCSGHSLHVPCGTRNVKGTSSTCTSCECMGLHSACDPGTSMLC